MQKHSSHRAVAILLALAAIAFTASGVPDNRGTDAAIGWYAFLALALALAILAGAAVVRRLRRDGAAAAQTLPQPPRRSKENA